MHYSKFKAGEAKGTYVLEGPVTADGQSIFPVSTVYPQSFTATRVAPPCCVTLGRHRSFTAPLENDSSVALLDHT